MASITELLNRADDEDPAVLNELFSVVYREMRAIAQRQMAQEAPDHTLQPTALVHEAYLRLSGGAGASWSSRRHFFAAAARAMRQIRIDDARKKKRQKRGGGVRPRSLADSRGEPGSESDPAEWLALNEALVQLEQEDPRRAEVVSLRYFGGLSIEECAATLGVSVRTVNNDWRYARAWLHKSLYGSENVF